MITICTYKVLIYRLGNPVCASAKFCGTQDKYHWKGPTGVEKCILESQPFLNNSENHNCFSLPTLKPRHQTKPTRADDYESVKPKYNILINLVGFQRNKYIVSNLRKTRHVPTSDDLFFYACVCVCFVQRIDVKEFGSARNSAEVNAM